MSGKNNILKSNGGSITGIFQKQTNPQCDSILDVAYTITGATNLSVSGTGIIGIAQFKSKLKSGESGTIKITDGYLIDFNGTKTPVTMYTGGIYLFSQPVSVARQSETAKNGGKFLFSYSNNIISFHLPFEKDLKNCPVKISVFDFKGRLVSVLFNGLLPGGDQNFTIDKSALKFGNRFYLCSIRYGSVNESSTIFINN
jgi:hypothetical protein